MELYYDQLKRHYLFLKRRLNGDRSKEQALLVLELCRFLLEHVQDPQREIEELLLGVADCKELSGKLELFKAQMYFSSGQTGLAKQILRSGYKEAVALGNYSLAYQICLERLDMMYYHQEWGLMFKTLNQDFFYVKMMYYRIILDHDTGDIDGSRLTGVIKAYFLAFQVIVSFRKSNNDYKVHLPLLQQLVHSISTENASAFRDTVLIKEKEDCLVLGREYHTQIHALVYFLSGLAYKRTDTLKSSIFLKEGSKFIQGIKSKNWTFNLSGYFYRHLLDVYLARSDIDSSSSTLSSLLESCKYSNISFNINMYHGFLSVLGGDFLKAGEEFEKALKVSSSYNRADKLVIYFQLFLLARSQNNILQMENNMNQIGSLCSNPEFEYLKGLHSLSLGMYHLATDSYHSSKLHLVEAFNLANTLYPTDQLRLLSLMVMSDLYKHSGEQFTQVEVKVKTLSKRLGFIK